MNFQFVMEGNVWVCGPFHLSVGCTRMTEKYVWSLFFPTLDEKIRFSLANNLVHWKEKVLISSKPLSLI